MNETILVGIGGIIGGIIRYASHSLLDRKQKIPVKTLFVNAIGSFVLGYLTFSGIGGELMLFIGVGTCGAFTTFSTFSFELFHFWESDQHSRFLIYGTLSLVLSISAVGLGWYLATL